MNRKEETLFYKRFRIRKRMEFIFRKGQWPLSPERVTIIAQETTLNLKFRAHGLASISRNLGSCAKALNWSLTSMTNAPRVWRIQTAGLCVSAISNNKLSYCLEQMCSTWTPAKSISTRLSPPWGTHGAKPTSRTRMKPSRRCKWSWTGTIWGRWIRNPPSISISKLRTW